MKEFVKNIKKLKKYCKGQNGRIFLLILFSLIMVALNVVMPLISARIIVLLTENNYLRIIYMAIVILVINSSHSLAEYFTHRIKLKLFRDIFLFKDIIIDF